jgi:hypothetical protein
MNEAHGPATEILFDIGHRRHPVRYESPAAGKSRKQIISELANSLVDALRPTVMLGPRSIGIDSDRAYELEANQIKTHWESKTTMEAGAVVFFTSRPTRYQARRWPDADALDDLIRKRQSPDFSGLHYYPPSIVGTDTMPWGIYNGEYATPSWALTYSGQFWAAISIAARRDYQRSHRDLALDRAAYEEQPIVPAGQWIDYPYARVDIADAFRFSGSFAQAFHPQEQWVWSAKAERIQGTILAASNPRFFIDGCRKCASPGAYRSDVSTAQEFSERWTDGCLDFLHELFAMYTITGVRITRDTLQKWLMPLIAGRGSRA